MAVRAGDEILGSIWVAEGDRPFGREAADALREAAQIAALHLIRHRASEDLDRRRRSDQLRAVLDGRLPTEVLAGTLGLPSTALVTVVIFSIGEAGPDRPARTVLAERAAGIIALHCEAFRRHAATVPLGASVYVLLSHNEGLERAALLPFVSSVADRSAEALGARVTAAVGSTVSLTDVSASRLEADQTLRALHAEGRGRSVATIDDVRSTAVLLELREHATRQPAILEGKAHLLAEHDAARGTDYVATLRAYLDAFGDVPRAAAAVAVHPNTFRYRLRRLAELADLDLTDPTERLVVSLQLAIEHPGP
jgi:sugar diacid utilization regulator